jgi:hypothetical protein
MDAAKHKVEEYADAAFAVYGEETVSSEEDNKRRAEKELDLWGLWDDWTY